MQALLASLVVSMGVQDAAFKAGMGAARREVGMTERSFDRGMGGMARSVQSAARQVDAAINAMVAMLEHAQQRVRNVGVGMTVALTVPLALASKTAKDSAADFQTAMAGVRSAMLDASPAMIDKLREAALKMGPAMGKSAIEAAGAIENLAKAGMSAEGILAGGLDGALKLSVVGQADLGDAAKLTTDIVSQFGKSASDVPAIVDKVTGALDASKMEFNDYRLSLAQAGGIVGGLGRDFDDLNVALAATASFMGEGSDAGTSFRTFITTLAPASKEAAKIMDDLGVSFFDAQGGAKSLSEVAEILHEKFGKLSDKDLTNKMRGVFGQDAMRTAIALTRLGSKGLDEYAAKIANVTAGQKLGVLMDTEAQSAQRLANAYEHLKIVIGEAGLLQVMQFLKDTMAQVVNVVASAPRPFFYLLNVAGLLAATLGPVIVIGAKLVPMFVAWRLAGGALAQTFGVVAGSARLLMNPMGSIIGILGRTALMAGAATAIGRLGTAMLGVAGPVGLAVTALSLIVPLYIGGAQASDTMTAALENAQGAHRASIDLANQLTLATKETRNALLEKAKADRAAAIEAVHSAKATLAAARAESERARTAPNGVAQKAYSVLSAGSSSFERSIDRWAAGKLGLNIAPDRLGSALDYEAAAKTQNENVARYNVIDKAIRAAEAPSRSNGPVAGGTGGTGGVAAAGGGRGSGAGGPAGKTAEDQARDAAQYADELGRMRVEELRAQADLTESVEARHRAEIAAIAEDRASYLRSLEIDSDKTEAQKQELAAQQAKVLAIRTAAAEQAEANGIAQRDHEAQAAVLDAEEEVARATMDIADSVAGRRAGELRLLDIQRRREEAEIDLVLATKNSATEEWSRASARKDKLAAVYAARAEQVSRQNEGPGASYLRSLNRSAANIGEAVEAGGVSALQDLNSELVTAGFNVTRLGSAFANMGKRILSTLAEIAVQQMLVKPMAAALFGSGSTGGGGGGGGLLSGLVSGFGSIFGGGGGDSLMSSASNLPKLDVLTNPDWGAVPAISFGGARVTGGAINDNEWYWVGERGPERFYPGVSGTVVPNQGRGDMPAPPPAVVQLAVGAGELFQPTVRQISGSVSIETVGRVQRTSQLQADRTLPK